MLNITDITESVSKILAQENITIIQQPVETASFDLESRTLVLPLWAGLEPEIEKMLAFHEVSHALFTPTQYTEEIRKTPEISDILNVIEDHRVERLFKKRYPGSRRDFVIGYNILSQKDFFGIKSRDLSQFNLIDRLNIFFKLGAQTGVKFFKEETVFVKRAQEIVTFDEALQLAHDILAYCKQQRNQQQFQQQNFQQLTAHQKEINKNDGILLGIASLSNDSETSIGNNKKKLERNNTHTTKEDAGELSGTGQNISELEDFKSKTKKALEENLKAYISNKIILKSVNPINYNYKNKYITPYKKILAEFDNLIKEEDFDDVSRHIINRKINETNHMVSLFEMKKAANEFLQRRVSKTGLIDTKRISLYRFTKDIFKRKIEVPNGKNHGFIFLLDYSSSMMGFRFYESLLQTITMAMFCRKVGVPYRIFIFLKRSEEFGNPSVNLLEIFSSEMKTHEFNKMLKYCCFGPKYFLRAGYPMSLTPLNESLLFMADYLLEFKQKYSLQKLNFTVFTDGKATDLIFPIKFNYFDPDLEKRKIWVYTDPKTKKNYYFFNYDQSSIIMETTNILFQLIKDRDQDIIVNTYFLGKYEEGCKIMGISVDKDKERVYNKNGFVALKAKGRDTAYIVSPHIFRSSEDDELVLAIDSSTSPAKIAREIKRLAKISSKGKLLLQHFIETIS